MRASRSEYNTIIEDNDEVNEKNKLGSNSIHPLHTQNTHICFIFNHESFNTSQFPDFIQRS